MDPQHFALCVPHNYFEKIKKKGWVILEQKTSSELKAFQGIHTFVNYYLLATQKFNHCINMG